MAGFGTALAYMAAGAAKTWGEGRVEEIKQLREEKLKQLELDRADRMEARRIDFQRSEGALGRQSQEGLTKATLGVQERLGELSAATTRATTTEQITGQKDITKLELGGRKELSDDQIAARKDEVAAQIAGQKDIASTQIAAQIDLQKMQDESAQRLNTKYIQQADGTSVLQRPDGTTIKMPIDPATGKPMNPAITDADTNEVKNMKALIGLGVAPEEAQRLVFSSKNADRNLAQAGIFKSILDGMTTMKNGTEEDVDFAREKSKQITDSIYGAGGAAAPTSATAPAAGAAAAGSVPRPPGATDEALISDALAAIKANKSKTFIVNQLQGMGVDPAKMSAAGL